MHQLADLPRGFEPGMSVTLRCEPGGETAPLIMFRDGQRLDSVQIRFNFAARNLVVGCGRGEQSAIVAKKRLTDHDGGALTFTVVAGEDGAGSIDLGPHGAIDFAVGGLFSATRSILGFGSWAVVGDIGGLGVAEGRMLVRSALGEIGRDEPWFSRSEPIVFDVGMHNGADTAFYLAKGFRVAAIEANPSLAAACAWAYRDAVADGRLIVLGLGVGDAAKAATFYVNRAISEWSSFVRDIASRGHEVDEVVVNIVEIGRIVEALGAPYFMKVDIEGHDRLVVRALAKLKTRPIHVSFENGPPAMLAELAAAGYDRFKYVEQSDIPRLVLPEPAREGRHVDHRFEYGSSGPFGEETPGDWLDLAQAQDLAQTLWGEGRRPAEGQWFDVHARLSDAARAAGSAGP